MKNFVFPGEKVIRWFLVTVNIFLFFGFMYAMGMAVGESTHYALLSLPATPDRAFQVEAAATETEVTLAPSEFQNVLDRNIFAAVRKAPPPPPPVPEVETEVDVTPVPVEMAEEVMEFEPPLTESEVTEPIVEVPTGPVVTTLPVELRGTYVRGPHAYAWIALQGHAQEKVFGKDDCFIFPRLEITQDCSKETIQVVKIENRQIAILHKTQEEWLFMGEPPENSVSAADLPSPPPARQQVSQSIETVSPAPSPAKAPEQKTPAVSAPPPPANPTPSGPVSTDTDVFHLTREWVDEQMENFTKHLYDAQMVATNRDGTTFFMFRRIKKESLFEQLGFQRKDIILSVNDEAIDSLPKAMMLMNKFISERELTFHIERDGQEKALQYYIQ